MLQVKILHGLHFPEHLQSSLHGNSIFRHIHLPLHPRLQPQCLRMLKAFAVSGKVIHMISNFFDQPQFALVSLPGTIRS